MIPIQDICYFDIEPTAYCNLHCPQCDRFDRQGFENRYMKLQHLDFDKIKHNINLDQLVGLQEVILSGDHGDPAMHPDIEKIIEFFQRIKQVRLVTNGSLRSEKWFQSLTRFKNLSVTFSVDGLKDTLQEYRINADYDKIMANARAYIKAGGSAAWKFVVFHHNQHQIEQARELASQMGFKEFWNEVSNRNFYDQDEFPVFIDGKYQNRNLKMSTLTQTRHDSRTIMIQQVTGSNFKPVTCGWARQKWMYIDYTGNLLPCCMTSGLMWRKDISGQLWQKIVGDPDSINLYHHELSEILKSDFYQHRLHDSLQSIKTVHHACVGNCS